MKSGLIKDVTIQSLETHEDERGFFREICRVQIGDRLNSEKYQISHSFVKSGVIKGWHGHRLQYQYNYVLSGKARVVLVDCRSNSETYHNMMSFEVNAEMPSVYHFSPGILHGYKSLSDSMHIIYFNSGFYDLNQEIRVDLCEYPEAFEALEYEF